ncbi:MAG: glycyl-radical enzyme activating protein [Candidatus Omnitrophota bacterium]
MNEKNLRYFDISWFSAKDGPGTRTVLFLQGCHLRCPWCHSPQSQETTSPLLFFENRCLFCGACVSSCPHHVHAVENRIHTIDRTACRRCGACVKNCPVSKNAKWNTGALGLAGIDGKPEELFQLLRPQLALLKNIGGLTVSGGEPLLQVEPLADLLTLCKRDGIHTAIETSASLPVQPVESLIPLVDHWLIGLRPILNNEATRTGDWTRVTHNLERLVLSNRCQITIRTPIIPGYTDHIACAQKIAETMKSFALSSIELLPYNRLSNHYYQAMNKPFPLEEHHEIRKPNIESIRNYFADQGFDINIID